MMGWPLFWRAPAAPVTPPRIEIAFTDLTRSARKRIVSERQARLLAALRRDLAAGRTSPIRDRAAVVVDIRRDRANHREHEHG